MGGKQIKLSTMTKTERGFHGYLLACGVILAAVLAMGADNAARLERCEASGRGAAECRLLVLGR